MGLIAKDENDGQRMEPVRAGVHIAVCYGVCDIGTQETEWQGELQKKRKVLVFWELPGERLEYEKNGQKMEGPRVIHKRYTLSLHENATLRHDLESWRGCPFTQNERNGFDLQNLIGVNGQILVVHNESNGKTYANVKTIMPLAPGVEKRQQENPTLWYSMDEGMYIPEGMYPWVVDVTNKSIEFKRTRPSEPDESTPSDNNIDDSCPF
jgi:hypothetical protein